MVGSEENIIKPSFMKQLDYEAELAVAMNREAKNATSKEAESSIFGYTSNMVLNVFKIVCSLSDVMTLEPCNSISPDTPAGVNFAIKPNPRFLQEDDLVEIEIEGIRIFKNRVVEDSNRGNR